MENMQEKPNGRGFMRIVRAMVCSWQGFRAAWRHEAAFRQEALLAIVLIPLGLWLGQGGVQRALLAGIEWTLLIELQHGPKRVFRHRHAVDAPGVAQTDAV